MKKSNQQVAGLLAQARQFSQSGQPDVSAKKYQQILSLQPKHSTAHFELGVLAFTQGQQQSAISYMQQAIELDSSQSMFHNGLGIVYSNIGDLPAGMLCFERALKLNPGNAVMLNNLGSNYKDQGKLADAVDCYQKAASANPKYAGAYTDLGEGPRRQRNFPAAADAYRQALAAGADGPEIHFNLAVSLLNMGNDQEAAKLFKTASVKNPQHPGAFNNLGLALIGLDKFDEAIANYKKAIDIEPSFAAAHNNLGNALRSQNKLNDAIVSYRHALTLQPDHAGAHTNLLLTLNYLPEKSQAELYEAALQFETQHASNLLPDSLSYPNSKDKHKRLRIGYVSPDFRAHSITHFTIKLIGTHHRNQVEVFCYSNVIKPDSVTSKIRALADHWISIVGMDDQSVADQIRKDQIDILVDLAGHTADNRLLVFARKPAPVQVNWLGYPNTTGMSTIDYRLTDAIADPPGEADQLHTEKLIRLPQGFLCYQTDDPHPAVVSPPCLEQGHITFGSFNNLSKMTPDVIRTWSTILQSVPDARLVLKSKAFAHETTRTQYAQKFQQHGISPGRLELFGLIPGRGKHLALYSKIDIGLDPFPYNGTTTTCEALWMGVPVISLLGNRHAGRVSASIMHHLGLPEWVADNEDEYIEMARSLADDRQQLISLREKLRPMMLKSALMDTEGFTQSLENTYREIWQTWCNKDHFII